MTVPLPAARTYAGNLYRLPSALTSDEHAELTRKLAEDDLICPVTDCPSPELMWVAATADTSMYLTHRNTTALDHTEETIRDSIWRLQAKTVLADWLTDTQKVRVSKERFHHSGERKPALTIMMSGAEKIVVEFAVDSGMREDTIEGWRQLNKQHNDTGTPVLWMIPHHGEEGIDKHQEGESFTLTRFQRLLLENDVPLFWFNPAEETVSTVIVKRRKEGAEYSVPPTRATLTAVLQTSRLTDCFLTPTGLQHPALATAAENLHPDAPVSTDVSRLRNQIRAKALAAGETNLPDCYPNLGFTINPSLATSWTELREKAEENGYADISEILYVRNLYENDVDERIARASKKKDSL